MEEQRLPGRQQNDPLLAAERTTDDRADRLNRTVVRHITERITRAKKTGSFARASSGLGPRCPCRRPSHQPNRRSPFWQLEHIHGHEAEQLLQCRAALAAGLDVRW
jgi:hypothetical protein